jgi:ADP-ribosylglycohydrolase
MLGAIIGDIVGSLHEGSPSRGRHFTLFTPRSCFTDDTVLTIAVAHALRTGTDFATALRDWARRYPTAGYGAGFIRWFEQDDAGPYNSYGNGSAMRVAAVAWALDDLEAVIAEAERTALPTHNHPEGIRGACAIAAAIHLARSGAGKEDIATLMQQRFGYNCRIALAELEDRGGFDATCQGTVPMAVAAFLHAKDFEDAVRIAVSLGGDTDTLACIAGSIAEAHFGIPAPLQAEALRRLDARLREELRLFALHHQLTHLAAVFPELHQPRSVEGVASGVLVEGVSVVVRVDAIHHRLPGGWRAFRALVPNRMLCADMELASVGFMAESDANAFADKLVKLGLRHLWEGHAIDLVVADMVHGAHSPCDWLHLERVKLTPTGSRVMAACLKGGRITHLAVPEGWHYGGSLSRDFCYRMPVQEDGTGPKMYRISGGPE